MPNGARILPQVSPGVDVPLAVTPQALGAGVGQAVQNAGDLAFDFHQKEVQRFNETAILDADNKLNAWANSRLYDPASGVLKQPLGKDAPLVADQTVADFDKQMADIGATLTNDDQRMAFQRMAQERRFHVERQLGDYEEKETERFADETDEAAIALASQAAVTDAAAADDHVQQMVQIIDRRGERKNTAPEMLEAERKAAASATYADIITTAADAGDTAKAREYFAQWGDQIQGRDLKEVRGVLKVSGERAESRALADEIVAGLGDEPDLQGALEALEAKGVENTEIYDQAKQRLTNTFRLAEEAETNRQVKLLDEASAAIYAAPGSPDAIPDSVWSKMTGPYKRKAQEIAKAAAKGTDIETPASIFAALERLKATDPQGFRQQNLALVPLSRSDFERYTKDQAAIAKGDDRLIASFQSDEQAVKKAMAKGGMTPAKGDDAPSDDEVLFRRQLANAVTAEQNALGRKVGPDRIFELGTELMRETVLTRNSTNWWGLYKEATSIGVDLMLTGRVTKGGGRLALEDAAGTDKYAHAFQTPVSDQLAYSYSQVPEAAIKEHRDVLEQAAKEQAAKVPGSRPIAVTEEDVRNEYNKSLIERYRSGD